MMPEPVCVICYEKARVFVGKKRNIDQHTRTHNTHNPQSGIMKHNLPLYLPAISNQLHALGQLE